MQAKKLIREVFRIIVVLLIWFVLAFLGFNIAQGPDRLYDLGNGYKIVRWPGPIDRWNIDENVPVEQHYHEKILEEDVTAFYVDSTWIVGRTYRRWFGINKQTGELYYPYKSHEELCAATGFSFSPNKLVTGYPLLYEVIWAPAKCVVAIISILALIMLIGFRRPARIITALFNLGQKKIQEGLST